MLAATKVLNKLVNKKDVYAYQEKLFWETFENDKVIVNKARQIGISFWLASFCMLYALSGKRVVVVSPSDRISSHFMSYVENFVNLNFEFRQQVKELNKSGVVFKNGGYIYSLPNSPSTVRGYPADFLVLDEFSHFLNGSDKEIWDAVFPFISRGGKLVIVSTPFGERGLFYDFWANAERKGYKRMTIHYSECPDLNVPLIKQSLDDLSFQQEYCNTFLGDVGSYFSYDLLYSCVGEPKREEEAEIYMGIDVGRRSDFTAIVIAGLKNGVWQVFHQEKLKVGTPFKQQKERIRELINSHKPLKVCIDEGGIGMQLAEELKDEFGCVKKVSFTNENKNEMATTTKRLFENKQIIIPSDVSFINAIHFIQRTQLAGGVKYDSDKTDETGHSDCFWALALAIYCTDSGGNISVIPQGLDETQNFTKREEFNKNNLTEQDKKELNEWLGEHEQVL